MNEIKIKGPFTIKNRIPLSRNIFEGALIYQDGVEVKIKCANCLTENSFTLNDNTGDLLDDLFLKYNFVTRQEILKWGIAKENSKINRHLGEMVVFPNLSALYTFLECDVCKTEFIVVFSFGEPQPGRNLCFVSGVWSIGSHKTG